MSNQVFYVKELNSDASVYFYGPFPNIGAAREYIDYLVRDYWASIGDLSIISKTKAALRVQ